MKYQNWSQLFVALSCVLILFSGCKFQQKDAGPPSLELFWKLEGFAQPESVVYDAKRDVFYISNIQGDPKEKDGQGFISVVSGEGEMLNKEWVNGLHAPKGLALHNDTLYAADMEALIEIPIETIEDLKRYAALDSKMLNDVTVATDGSVYISDLMGNTIYRFHNAELKPWLQDEALELPNGLLAQEDDLLVVSWGKLTGNGYETEIPGTLRKIGLADKQLAAIGAGQPLGNLDGIAQDKNGRFWISDWMSGKILLVNKKAEVLYELELQKGTADLTLVPSKGLLLVPMMNSNELRAYRVR